LKLPHPEPRSTRVYASTVIDEECELEGNQILMSTPKIERPGTAQATASSAGQVQYDPREDYGKRPEEPRTAVNKK
jgi:hypothetical protein